MAVDRTIEGSEHVNWVRADIVRDGAGRYLLPVTVGEPGQEQRTHVRLTPDQAAVLHAQLSRHLMAGWAVTEDEKRGREIGECYPVDGSGQYDHLHHNHQGEPAP